MDCRVFYYALAEPPENKFSKKEKYSHCAKSQPKENNIDFGEGQGIIHMTTGAIKLNN